MRILRKGRSRNNQAGFLLVEAILSIAISALIGLGAAVAAAQVCTQTSQNSDYTAASRQAMNALSWLGQDAQMAQSITGAAGFPQNDLVFSWTLWDNTQRTVTYSLTGEELRRTTSSGGETVVGEHIYGSLTGCTTNGDILTISVTAKVDNASVNKSREVVPRPRL